MPMDKSRYPKNWDAIALTVKRAAGWRCQECGKPCMEPGERLIDLESRMINDGEWETWHPELEDEVHDDELGVVFVPKPVRFVLTVAHLDQNPSNNDPANLKALCSCCHLRHDAPFRKANSQAKRERQGQLNVFDLTAPELAGHGLNPSRIQAPIRMEVE